MHTAQEPGDTMSESEERAQRLAERTAEAMFERDRASQMLGMRIAEMRPGYARVVMDVRADMVNGLRICHGGLIFSLADSAFAFACNSYNEKTVAAAASSSSGSS